ncbi:type IV pilus modification PilV family protein [Dermatobacter hominis]|uniref:type IV pilus modification PilV family protein n=1 Tax=Dermatobacter hominis TaxID=2884263 RepID=UPI001D10BCAD|nr:hypothetical protein [Dermatobacter hominis]UDY37958.1 hypothetical protein LH044_10525 [Dermatobacter hominis]
MASAIRRRKGHQPDARPNRAGGRHALGRARSQGGFSLVESLAALLLTTVVILGVAAGIITTVTATESVARTQKAEAALTDATEAVKALPYQPCAATYSAIPGAAVTAVEYLQPGTGGEVYATSPCSVATDVAQRITISVDGRTAAIVKRNPSATAVTP